MINPSSLNVAADAATSVPEPLPLAVPAVASTPAPNATDVSNKPTTFKPHRKTYSLMGVQIAGTGSFVPDNVVTNDDLKRTRGFDPAWIEQRLGNSRTPTCSARAGDERHVCRSRPAGHAGRRRESR